MNVLEYLAMLLQTGLGSLAAYLAAHVLLWLLPAFFIAGALSVLIPKEAVTNYLGRNAPKWISYPASALGGFVLAVCSCTIMPLFASIYKKGQAWDRRSLFYSSDHPCNLDRNLGRAQHGVGEPDRRVVWRLYVVSYTGRSARRSDVPFAGDASRPAAGLSAG